MEDQKMQGQDIEEDEHARGLRAARAGSKDATTAENEQALSDGSSEEEHESEKTALNIMTWFNVAGDLLGWIPFVGGIVRFITGVGAVIQSFKLNISVRVTAWIINGVIALIQVLLSFVGLNFFPLQTIGAVIIRMMRSNVMQEKTNKP